MNSRSLSVAEWLVGGGEMGKLVRSMDWTKTPLGAIESWPESLRTTVNLALASNFPISIAWGPQRVQIYNDGYWPICGGKHPKSMGQDFKECWFSAWPAIGDAFESATAGKTAFLENQRMFLDRHGYLEETFFTFSFSPIRDETGRVAGLFHPVTEMTGQTLAERRLQVLREVSDETADARTVAEASELIVRAIARHPLDVPFAILFLLGGDGKVGRLAGAAHLDPGSPAAPRQIELGTGAGDGWPPVLTAAPFAVERLEERFGPLGCGPYPESPQIAMVLPIHVAGLSKPLAVLIAGVSPRRTFDPTYRTFYLMLQEAVTNSLVNARSYEQEKKRAEALAELDRAKTTFFSNVSHEFRTPLTLMLGPLEDALASAGGDVSGAVREQLRVAHRNSLRLLKLVNSLLDFSRIEAGRVQASYAPTDLATLTEDLASSFRSACEKAGLELRVDCPSMSEPIYADREMWEKILLNLLSNAFKFTMEGAIEVSLGETGEGAVLRVRDTGVGIPGHELPRLFERFHRVEGTRGRTHEGTGIGLALVQELVKLHGGTIDVESSPGSGTTFTVGIPRGSAHLPPEHVGSARTLASTATGAAAYVEEAMRWLPDGAASDDSTADEPMSASAETVGDRGVLVGPGERVTGRVLLADDNADMRDYVARLLRPRFHVETAPDGEAALALIRRSPPDLVLSDVMMPGLDGFGLLRALRAEESTRSIPVILLSARAGDEARVEGLDAGADDYLIKPFSARELLARVGTHLKLARIRRESELRFRGFADTAPTMLWITDAEDRCTFLSRSWCEFTGRSEEKSLGFGWLESIHPDDREQAGERFLAASARREPFFLDYRLRRADGEYRWVIDAGRPRFDDEGTWLGYVGSVVHVHERKEAEESLKAREELVRTIAENSTQALVMLDDRGYCTYANRAWLAMTGYDAEEIRSKPLHDLVHHHRPDGRPYPSEECPIDRALPENSDVRAHGDLFFRKDGTTFPVLCAASPIVKDGKPVSTVLEVRDMTAAKRAEDALSRQSRRLGLLWEAAAVILTSEDPDTMLQRLFSKIGDHLGVDTYFNFMVDESGDALRLVSYTGISKEEARGLTRLELGQAVCGTVPLERRPIVATFIQGSDDPKAQLVKGFGIRAYACNPLIAGGRLLGTLSFASRTRDEFDADELEFLETISHYVTAAYRQLRLIAQLRETDRRKDEFLAMLGHELRNPLAPIRTGLQVMTLARNDPDVLERSLTIIDRQTRQLTRLIDDLLDVSRITRGKLHLQKSDIELAEVVESAVEASSPFIDEARHELTVDLPEEPIFLHADLTRLAQVFSNLLSNAAKYTPEGGRIVLRARRKDGELTVTVEDNGLGIPEEMLDRVFEMFTQVDRSDKGYRGLGLGLTLVKSLVEMHGGSVSVRSEGPNRGSSFTVRLPCAVEPSRPDPPEPAPERRASRKRRVLVVDDNQDAANLLSVAVRMLGHQVRTAPDGFEAVVAAGEFRPDVVLMDLGMPRMTGYEAARRIRKEPWGKTMTLVAVTGWGQEADKRKSREAGFDHHLVKPVEPPALQAVLDGVSTDVAGGSER